MARVVVIGAGIAGLSVAARLAKLRHTVAVVERQDRIGGQVQAVTHSGFTFDTGPGVLLLPAVFRDTFRKSGRPLERELDLVPVETATAYRFADGTRLHLPNASRAATMDAISEFAGSEGASEWDALVRRGEAIWQAVRQPILESPPGGPGSVWPVRELPRRVREVAPWSTLRRLGRRRLTDPRLRMVLEHHSSYVGSDPRQAPAALALLPYVEQTFGVWRVVGGMYRLVEALHDRVLLRKVGIRLGRAVTEVTVSGGRVSGVRLSDGEVLDADVVVSAIDSARLYRDLVQVPSVERVRHRLHRLPASASVFTVLLALRGRSDGLAHRTVLFGKHRDEEYDSSFGPTATLAADPTMTVYAPDDPALRPDDNSETWVVQVTVPRHGIVDWSAHEMVDNYANRLLGVLAERGYDVRDRVVWRSIRTPYDLEVETGIAGGAVYGTPWHGPRSAFLRPANRSPVHGLFLVGGSAHPGSGLPFVGLSAKIVADLVGAA